MRMDFSPQKLQKYLLGQIEFLVLIEPDSICEKYTHRRREMSLWNAESPKDLWNWLFVEKSQGTENKMILFALSSHSGIGGDPGGGMRL